MVGELITLPLRLGMRAADTVLRTGVTVSGRTLQLAGELLKTFTGSETNGAVPTGADGQAEGAPQRPRSTATGDATAQPAPSRPAISPEPPQEPAHVSEEAVLVDELAESGAEDGAGATIEVAEPWEGYDQMTAKKIVAQLRSSTAAQLAMVELYESANRNRETVLAAVKRRLKTADRDGRTT
jgi:hypothetical protein